MKRKNIFIAFIMLFLLAGCQSKPIAYDINTSITPNTGRVYFIYNPYNLSTESTTFETSMEVARILLTNYPSAIKQHDFHLGKVEDGNLIAQSRFNHDLYNAAYVDLPEGQHKFVLARTNVPTFNVLGQYVSTIDIDVVAGEKTYILLGQQGSIGLSPYVPAFRVVNISDEQEQYCINLGTQEMLQDDRISKIETKYPNRFFSATCIGLMRATFLQPASERYKKFYGKKADKIAEIMQTEKSLNNNLTELDFTGE